MAAAEIYTMLKEHKGRVTVKIDAIAASAASVIAMAGDRVLMSPVAMLMIHDPMTIAMGNTADMEKAIVTLNEFKESIINAYVAKSGMSRGKVAKLMSDETWMNARKAVEYGFADEILFADGKKEKEEKEKDDEKEVEDTWKPYSTRGMGQAILNRLICSAEGTAGAGKEPDETAGGKEDVEQAEAGMSDPAQGEEQTEVEAEKETEPDSDSDTATDTAGPMEKAGTAPEEVSEKASEKVSEKDAPGEDTHSSPDDISAMPVIGMDGKTKDGAMPYEILKDRLEWMR